MKNLIFQYYIPYEANDTHLGGVEMPDWAKSGSRCAQKYAKLCGADYMLLHDRFFPDLDPRLDSSRIHYDSQFTKYDKILVLDLDMLITTRENIFDIPIQDVAMVHEVGIHEKMSGWLRKVMNSPLEQRGIIAYGKKLFGDDWMFPKSTLYPLEKWRYMNGGLQLWSKEGREKAKEHFTSLDDYVIYTRYTEQMYVNLQLTQPVFNVTELDNKWNRLPYQWVGRQPDGYINHFLARNKFSMPELEKRGMCI